MPGQEFTPKESCWYAWQMFPGYCHAPYFSPVRIEQVQALDAPPGALRVRFLDAFNAEGPQVVALELRPLKRAREYFVADVLSPANPELDRTGVLSEISFSWLYVFAPEQMERRPPRSPHGVEESVQAYLQREFGIFLDT